MTSSSSIVAFPSSKTNPWIEEYQQACLTRHDAGTIRVYRQILHQFTHWVGKRAGQVNQFAPSQITTPVVEQYLQELASQAYSPSHCKRVRSVIAQFCQWLIEDKALLQRNPTRGIVVDSSEPPAPFDPRILSPVQRLVLQNLVKQEDRRGKALFALGYWVGCRVTDIVDLQLDDTHIGAKSGWLHLGGEGAKARDIDLVNEARRVLHEYLQHREREEGSPYVFLSQRSSRLTDAGLHHWFRALKRRAAPDDRPLFAFMTYGTTLPIALLMRAGPWKSSRTTLVRSPRKGCRPCRPPFGIPKSPAPRSKENSNCSSASQPLTSYAVILQLIAATTTEAGLTVQCQLDTTSYPAGRKISEEEMATLFIRSDAFHGEWNHTILPQAASVDNIIP